MSSSSASDAGSSGSGGAGGSGVPSYELRATSADENCDGLGCVGAQVASARFGAKCEIAACDKPMTCLPTIE